MLLALFVSACSSIAATFEGKVVKVSDGDTITVLRNGEQVKVRLGGIDAPEKDQPYGRKSRDHLASMVAGKNVIVDYTKTDRYGRVIGKVLVGGRDANLQQIKAGMAHWYEYYKADQPVSDRTAYSAAERKSRSAGIGLWSDPNPIDPYDWRKGKRSSASTTSSAPAGICGTKKYCSQMTSCAEAMFYLTSCGLNTLDGDSDGVPCEALCR